MLAFQRPTRRPHCRIHAAITDIPMITRCTKGLTRSSQSRIQGFISICDKTSAFNESPSLRAVRLNQWHGVADGYAFGRWHKWIPGYFFQCCPRQRLQYPWVNFTVRPRLDPGIASFLHQYTDADASRRAVARVECLASLYSSGPVCIPTPAEHGCSQNTNLKFLGFGAAFLRSLMTCLLYTSPSPRDA